MFMVVGASSVRAGTFTFNDPKDGRALLQVEDHQTATGPIVEEETTGKDNAGKVVLHETCRYDRDSLDVISYTFEDAGEAESREIQVKDGRAVINSRAGAQSVVETDEVSWPPGTYIPKLLPALVLRHWPDLIAGGPYIFRMFMPNVGRAFDFRLEAQRQSGEQWTVKVRPNSLLLRPFMPKIEFVVDNTGTQPHLRGYYGPASVVLNGERRKQVSTTF